jgi:hypothetical protein
MIGVGVEVKVEVVIVQRVQARAALVHATLIEVREVWWTLAKYAMRRES